MICSLFQKLTSPSPELINLLKNNTIGTPGKSLCYQQQNVEEKIRTIKSPYFINLVKNSSIIGTCTFCKRDSILKGKSFTTFYIRYFTFKEAYRKKSGSASSSLKSGNIRREIHSLLSGEGLEMHPSTPFFHYAYVDPRNTRSTALCSEFHFEPMREFSTILFHRFRPNISKQFIVKSIDKSEESKVRNMLCEFYKSHSMFSLENLFGQRTYYVLKDEKGNILAGAQAHPDKWKIHSMPGVAGGFLLSFLTRLPFLNRLIQKDFRFISLEGIFHTPGAASHLTTLFESLLAIHKVNTAITVVDTGSRLFTTLKALRLGWAGKFQKEVRGHVICRCERLSKEDKEVLKTTPAYLSTIDVT